MNEASAKLVTQSPARSRPGDTLLALALLIAIPIAALWPVCTHDFVSWDDLGTIGLNPSLNPVNLHSLHTWWTTTAYDLYVPITYTVWGMIAMIARVPETATTPSYLSPVPFHAANLILHVLSILVVFRLLHLLIGKTWPAAIGAMLFGLHPVQVEPVAWASGLKDVLGGLLALAAIWQYLLAVRKSESENESRIGWQWHYALAVCFFVLALLSKPTELVAPAIAGALDLIWIRRSWAQVLRWLWPWFVLSAGCLVVGHFVQPAHGASRNVAMYLRPIVAVDALGFYMRKLLWPTDLTVDYGLRPVLAAHSLWLAADAILIIGTAILLWRTRQKAGAVGVGMIVFVIALLPVAGFVSFDFQWYSTVADHYLYLPMVGIAIAAASLCARWERRPVYIGAFIVLGLLGAMSYSQTQYWKDTSTLFFHNMEASPDSATGYQKLAMVAVQKRDFSAAAQFSQEAIRCRPDGPMNYKTYGFALSHLGRNAEAAEQFSKALQYESADETDLSELANSLTVANLFTQAEPLRRTLLQNHPESADAHFDLASLLEREKKLPESIVEFRAATALDPREPKNYIGLAEALAESGQREAALVQYDQALALDPHSQAAQAGRQQLIDTTKGRKTP